LDFRRISSSGLPQLRRRWWLLIACTAGPTVLAVWIVDRAQFPVVLPTVAVFSLLLLGLGVDAWLSRRLRAEQADVGLLQPGGATPADHLLDPVSGARSRAALDRLLAELSTRDDHPGAAVSMIMIDLDEFKAINDQYGHPAGDAVLRACATRWQAMLRESDWLCRYGGDEFCVLLPGTALHQAKVVADKLMQSSRELIHVTDHAQRSTDVRLTISLGVAACAPPEAMDPTALLATADRMLYQSKAAGGDQITACSAKQEIHGQ
jgi:diguanylate cyclase (GGDEF)-like protein